MHSYDRFRDVKITALRGHGGFGMSLAVEFDLWCLELRFQLLVMCYWYHASKTVSTYSVVMSDDFCLARSIVTALFRNTLPTPAYRKLEEDVIVLANTVLISLRTRRNL